MKSRITIEVDFQTGLPYIQVINDTESDDMRDKAVSAFRQSLQHTSSWCKVDFYPRANADKNTTFTITPIKPIELGIEAEVLREAADLYNNWVKEYPMDSN